MSLRQIARYQNRFEIMNLRASILALLTATLLVGPNGAQARDCKKGDTPQDHHVGSFNFFTTSWVEKKGNLRRYVSCVANLDPNSDLLVTWFIAGPFKTYVPSSDVQETRRLRDDVNPRPVSGCLQYGNLGEKTPAEFLGTADDELRNGKESNCVVTAAASEEANGADLPPDGWQDEVRVFIPSDPDNPHDSLLEVTGEIGLKPNADGFLSYFSYTAKPYVGRKLGNVEEVTVTPVFPVKADFFTAAFHRANKEVTPLEENGSISFDVPANGAKAWRPAPAYYEFRDKHNRLLGTIPMPLFQSWGR